MYEVHIRQKNPENPAEIWGMIMPQKFKTIPKAKKYLKKALKNLEIAIVDAETQEIVFVWSP